MNKRIIALLGCIVLVLSMFSGCKKKEADGSIYENFTPAGTLYIDFGVSIEVVYDDEGKALQLVGTNQAGKQAATNCTRFLGKPCSAVVWKLLEYSVKNKLTGSTPLMVIRLDKTDVPPSDDFLTAIATPCQQLSDRMNAGIRVFAPEGEQLDEEGQLTSQTAKALAAVRFGCAETDITGGEALADGVYTFTCNGKTCTVDAFSGVTTLK